MTVIVFVIIFFGFFIFMADQENKSQSKSQWKIIITVNNIYGDCTSCK